MNTITIHRFYVQATDTGAAVVEVVETPARRGYGVLGMNTEVSRELVHNNLTTEYADTLCAMLNKHSMAAHVSARIEFMHHASIGNLGERSYMENVDTAYAIAIY
jgi:hypothetical protein